MYVCMYRFVCMCVCVCFSLFTVCCRQDTGFVSYCENITQCGLADQQIRLIQPAVVGELPEVAIFLIQSRPEDINAQSFRAIGPVLLSSIELRVAGPVYHPSDRLVMRLFRGEDPNFDPVLICERSIPAPESSTLLVGEVVRFNFSRVPLRMDFAPESPLLFSIQLESENPAGNSLYIVYGIPESDTVNTTEFGEPRSSSWWCLFFFLFVVVVVAGKVFLLCLFVCLFVGLFVCLFVCLFVSLSVCLFVCPPLPPSLFLRSLVWLHGYLCTYMYIYTYASGECIYQLSCCFVHSPQVDFVGWRHYMGR